MPAGGGKPRSITAAHDRSFDGFAWGDNATIYAGSERDGGVPMWKINVKDSGPLSELISGGSFGSPSVSKDGTSIATTHATMNAPAEVVLIDTATGKAKNLTDVNAKLLAEITMNKAESVTVKGAGGTPMQMWILSPPGFDASGRWCTWCTAVRKARWEIAGAIAGIRSSGRRRDMWWRCPIRPRQHGLWPEVCRRDQRRLGWQVL